MADVTGTDPFEAVKREIRQSFENAYAVTTARFDQAAKDLGRTLPPAAPSLADFNADREREAIATRAKALGLDSIADRLDWRTGKNNEVSGPKVIALS